MNLSQDTWVVIIVLVSGVSMMVGFAFMISEVRKSSDNSRAIAAIAREVATMAREVSAMARATLTMLHERR